MKTVPGIGKMARKGAASKKMKVPGAAAIATVAKDNDEATIERLEEIEWNFSSAKTGYLTHNLHPYPAKFIPQIPNALIQELSSPGETIADIFCGSGTTLLEALQLKRHAIGIDANPLAALISRAKTTTLTASEFDELAEHRNACERILEKAQPRTGDPFYSSGWRPEPEVCEFWFAPHVVEELAELRALIDCVPIKAARRLCTVVFAAIVVPVSKQDSDTRYVRREKPFEPGAVVRRYLRKLDSTILATREMSDLVEDRYSCRVLEADLLGAPETEPIRPSGNLAPISKCLQLSPLSPDPANLAGLRSGTVQEDRDRQSPEIQCQGPQSSDSGDVPKRA